MEIAKKVLRLSGLAAELRKYCCAFTLGFSSPDFVFTPTYIYIAHIRNSLSKLQSLLHEQHYKDHQVKRWDTHQNF